MYVPLFDLNNLVEKIEEKGWRVSDCLKFSEFNLNLIKLNVALMIAPESSLLQKLLSQLMVRKTLTLDYFETFGRERLDTQNNN